MKSKKTILLAIAIFFVGAFIGHLSSAKTVELYSNQQMIPGATSRTCDISTYLQQIIGFGYATIGILTMFMLGIGSYQYIMSLGNTAKMTSAKNTVNYAILGLVLGLTSWIILYTINPNLVKVSLGEPVPCTMEWPDSGTGSPSTTSGKYNPADLKKSTKERVKGFCDIIKQAAARYQVPESMIMALIDQESRGIPDARSPKGALGLMQLMPGTAADLGVTNSADPYQNIMGGTRHLAWLHKTYGNGNWERTLIAYNWGQGNLINKYDKNGWLPPETRAFVPSVLGKNESYKNDGCP